MTTRRALLALTLVLAVAACSGSGRDEAAPASAETVTVEHRFGTTEAPVRPQRIVSLDTQWTDVLLALDTVPVGYLRDPNVPDGFPWRGDRLDGATGMRATTALPFEQIVRLHPDLIVVTYFAENQAVYDRLSRIAPTITSLNGDRVDTWQEIARTAGEVLDDPAAAEALVDDVDGAVAAVADELPGLEGKTVALTNYVPGDAFYVVSDPADGANVLFDQLGLEISPTILGAGSADGGRVKLSLERADLLDADVLVLLPNGADPTEIVGWDDLPAVASGAVALLDYAEVTGLNTPTPLSVPYSLDLIRPALEAAAAG